MQSKDTYQLEVQHNKGKLHAIERIMKILDEGSFCEIGSGITNYVTASNLKKEDAVYDGVITGYGKINEKKVVIYAQDYTVILGTIGRNHGKKIAHAIRLAIENRCPVIGIIDSGGARIQEGVSALAGCGEMLYYNTLASGYIPQISIVGGNCVGAAAYSPGITDFVFMIDKIGSMYITGPRVVETVLYQKVSKKTFGDANMHHKKSGVIHFSAKTEEYCFEQVRKLLSLIPHCVGDKNECKCEQKLCEVKNNIANIMPQRRSSVYDMKNVIKALVDRESFLEVQEYYAPNIITGFARIGGRTIGIVANQPYHIGGVLDTKSSGKASRFIRYCDCFDISLLSLIDVPGFMPGGEQEEQGIIRQGAKLLYAYSESSIPKISVILRRAYGGAYIAMGSKHMGTDFNYAWPGAEIAVMGEEAAVQILFGKELRNCSQEEKHQKYEALIKRYQEDIMNVEEAVSMGYIDEVIKPEETRSRIISDFQFLEGKTSNNAIKKKHGNIPL